MGGTQILSFCVVTAFCIVGVIDVSEEILPPSSGQNWLELGSGRS
jgi:hypothetical protein